MRRAVVLMLGAALAAPAAASAETVGVGMPARVFSPPKLDVVVGDTVRWVNSSNEAHDISASDGTFGSGPVGPGGEFAQSFGQPGVRPYLCLVHRAEMQGELRVVPVTLVGPPTAATAGDPVALEGRAPAGTGSVTIEAAPRPDAAFAPVARVTPAADGRFRAAPRVDAPTTYRAAVTGGTSPPLVVPVVDRVRVSVQVVRGKRVTRLRVRTAPARPEAVAVLELYSPERFTWRRAMRGTLDATGSMDVTLAARVRRRARVVLLRPDGSVAARSAMVATWRERRRASAPGHDGPAPHH